MCNKDARMFLSMIKFEATQLGISGDLTKSFGRLDRKLPAKYTKPLNRCCQILTARTSGKLAPQ